MKKVDICKIDEYKYLMVETAKTIIERTATSHSVPKKQKKEYPMKQLIYVRFTSINILMGCTQSKTN